MKLVYEKLCQTLLSTATCAPPTRMKKANKSDEKKQQKAEQKLWTQDLAAARKGGDAAACFRVATSLSSGAGCPPHFMPEDVRGAELSSWLRKAANLGSAKAQVQLGNLQSSPEAAVAWYRKAALQGNGDGQYHLGEAYVAGDGVGQNFAEAAKCFRQVVDTGEDNNKCYAAFTMRATLQLAAMYKAGEGVEQDHAEAFRLYESFTTVDFEAANISGDERTLLKKQIGNVHYIIACGYYNGQLIGAERNSVKEHEHFLKAANLGHASAMVGQCRLTPGCRR